MPTTGWQYNRSCTGSQGQGTGDGPNFKALRNTSIFWGWIYPPHGTIDSKNDIQSKLQNLCNKADIKVVTATQTMDKISGMTEPEFRFEFEVGSAFSPFQLYKIAKITLSAGESKVLLNPEVCENYSVHRECLKLLNGRNGTMNLTLQDYSDSYYPSYYVSFGYFITTVVTTIVIF